MVKKRSLLKKRSNQRISNNILALILVVVIVVGLLTIGFTITSSNSKLSEQAIQIPSSDAATGIVTLKIISPQESEDFSVVNK